MSQFFTSGSQSISISAPASVLPINIQDDFLQDGLVGSPCSPRDSQESSPTPKFQSISSLALSFVYSPTLTSIHGYWKNYTFDQMDFCQQSNVSTFQVGLDAVQVGHSFSSKEQASSHFMALVTNWSDFGAQENKVCHCFHSFPIYLPQSKRELLAEGMRRQDEERGGQES